MAVIGAYCDDVDIEVENIVDHEDCIEFTAPYQIISV